MGDGRAIGSMNLIAHKTGNSVNQTFTGLKLRYDLIKHTVISNVYNSNLLTLTLQTQVTNFPFIIPVFIVALGIMKFQMLVAWR